MVCAGKFGCKNGESMTVCKVICAGTAKNMEEETLSHVIMASFSSRRNVSMLLECDKSPQLT